MSYPPNQGQPGYPPPYGQPTPVVVQQQQPATVVMMQSGNCPSCHRGNLVESFTVCGILWAVICFPIGLICCFTMKEHKCGVCGYHGHH